MTFRIGALFLTLGMITLVGCSSSPDSPEASPTTTPATATTTVGGTADTDASEVVWLCRPGMDDDPCRFDESITMVGAHGKRTVAHPEPAADPPADCFYVYPTVSTQQGGVANLDIDPEQIAVAHAQASRFSQVCRVFAPMYRQRTIGGIFGEDIPEDQQALGYQDVRAAWQEYLATDNDGRGVILIGHSQGSGVLTRLIAEEIETDPETRGLIVSAMLLGGWVTVPEGRDVGGSFQHLPVCTAADQTGCVIAYSAYRGTPVADALFGRASDGERVVCTNPAALGGDPAVLDSAFLTGESLLGSVRLQGAPVDTPWVGFSDAFTGECRSNQTHTWLEVSENPSGDHDPSVVLEEPLGPTWGLHLIDVNVALGDLLTLAKSQIDAW